MDIVDEIYKKQSGIQAKKILSIVLDDHAQLDKLMECFFSDNLRLCQTASWSVGMIAEKDERLLLPYFGKMVEQLDDPKHDAIVRNTLRSWQSMNIPEDYEGEVFERCFNYITSPTNAIAIRVFSMTVCYNIGLKYPELLIELKAQLEHCQLEEGKGILSRSRTILRKLTNVRRKIY